MQKHVRSINILLVEDNLGDIRLTQEALLSSKIPIQLSVVMDGEEALSYLRFEKTYKDVSRPDFVLLDLNIPKKSGHEVLAEIRSDEALRHLPVVVLTTSSAEQDLIRTYNLHVNAYINKPVDFDSFFEIVQKIENFWIMTAILPSTLR
jgi:two-component system, chemotaxis family, response regulator Rcp1